MRRLRPSGYGDPGADGPSGYGDPGSDPSGSRLSAILKRRCPRCWRGSVYESLMRPRESCPECGLVFEREPGYGLGSFYISYGLGAAVGIPTVLVALYGGFSIGWLFLLVACWVGVMAPLIVTYSRILWYHLDQLADPR